MKVGDRVYITQGLSHERPLMRVRNQELQPGSYAKITDKSSVSAAVAVEHDDGTFGVYFREELMQDTVETFQPCLGITVAKQKAQWLRFFELFLRIGAPTAEAALEADKAMTQWLIRYHAPKQALEDRWLGDQVWAAVEEEKSHEVDPTAK